MQQHTPVTALKTTEQQAPLNMLTVTSALVLLVVELSALLAAVLLIYKHKQARKQKRAMKKSLPVATTGATPKEPVKTSPEKPQAPEESQAAQKPQAAGKPQAPEKSQAGFANAGAAPTDGEKSRWRKVVDEPMIWIQYGFLFLTLVGTFIISQVEKEALSEGILHGVEFWSKLNEAILIAMVVSLIFDLGYHAEVFGDPVEQIEERVHQADNHVRTLGQHVNQLTVGIDNSDKHLERLGVHINQLTNGIDNSRQQVQRLGSHIDQLTTGIDNSGQHVNELGKYVEQLKDLMGASYDLFESTTISKFERAGKRILSASNFWRIPKAWWLAHTEWETLEIAKNLTAALKAGYGKLSARGYLSLEIKFMGNAPTPRILAKGSVGEIFDEVDFEKFLGVMWYCVVAHEVRVAVRKWAKTEGQEVLGNRPVRHEVPLVVLVAPTPFSAMVIDDVVWNVVSLDSTTQSKTALAIELTKNMKGPEAIKLADIYSELLNRYARYTRSAREYVESVLMLTLQLHMQIKYESKIKALFELEGEQIPFDEMLDRLGGKTWLKQFEEPGQAPKHREAIKHLFYKFFESLESAAQFRLLARQQSDRSSYQETAPDQTLRSLDFGDMYSDMM